MPGLAIEQESDQFFPLETMVPRHVRQNCGQGPDAQRIMLRDGDYRRRRGAASYGDDFFSDEVETDEPRLLGLLEVAHNRVSYGSLEIGKLFRFSEDRSTECSRRVSPSGASSTMKVISFTLNPPAGAKWTSRSYRSQFSSCRSAKAAVREATLFRDLRQDVGDVVVGPSRTRPGAARSKARGRRLRWGSRSPRGPRSRESVASCPIGIV